MQGKPFLWNVSSHARMSGNAVPAASASSQLAHSMWQGRQIVAAATDANGVRWCVLQQPRISTRLHCDMGELEPRENVVYFVRRWNFWVVSSEAELARPSQPTTRRLLWRGARCGPGRTCQRADSFLHYSTVSNSARAALSTSSLRNRSPTAAIQTVFATGGGYVRRKTRHRMD